MISKRMPIGGIIRVIDRISDGLVNHRMELIGDGLNGHRILNTGKRITCPSSRASGFHAKSSVSRYPISTLPKTDT